MAQKKITDHSSFKALFDLSQTFCEPSLHLKNLIKEPDRLDRFSLKIPGFFFDFSRQRMNLAVLDHLSELARESNARNRFVQMTQGEKINTTEKRAVLHTATREMTRTSIEVDGEDVLPAIQAVNKQIQSFSKAVRSKTILGSRQKPFTDAVVVGIGGSYLGCQFVYNALKSRYKPDIRLHFLSNVDIDNMGSILQTICPETCLWIIVSKSYTTTETMANLNQVQAFLNTHHLQPSDHIVTITARKPSEGPSPNDCLALFPMFDFIGGRYSVSSSVGGVPLSLAFGYEIFEQFLTGCHRMDRHAQQAPEEKNIPLMAALISIWNSNFLNYPAQAIIPYCSALSKLAPHVQQVYMESLGKSVTADGKAIDTPTGVIVFGEPGTNAQHSFFQLAHQGRAFPIEFIGVISPVWKDNRIQSKGVLNHQELWANMIAQAQALAVGSQTDDPARCFSGNRPSSTLLLEAVTAESIGMLLSFYEARTVFEGFILGVNPFDQFGVELGKVLASHIREKMAGKNQDASTVFAGPDPITDFYLNTLFHKGL